MSRIMVTGDSWSAGEWDPTLTPEETRAFAEKYSISRYLRDLGHEVAHAANPGWGDFVSLNCLMTHEMGFAKEVADQMIFMDEGMIVEKAPTNDFFAKPKSERTKLFLSQIL